MIRRSIQEHNILKNTELRRQQRLFANFGTMKEEKVLWQNS
jgi:hypothetical protein